LVMHFLLLGMVSTNFQICLRKNLAVSDIIIVCHNIAERAAVYEHVLLCSLSIYFVLIVYMHDPIFCNQLHDLFSHILLFCHLISSAFAFLPFSPSATDIMLFCFTNASHSRLLVVPSGLLLCILSDLFVNFLFLSVFDLVIFQQILFGPMHLGYAVLFEQLLSGVHTAVQQLYSVMQYCVADICLCLHYAQT